MSQIKIRDTVFYFLPFGAKLPQCDLHINVAYTMNQSFRIKTSALFGIDELLTELGGNIDQWLAENNLNMGFINTPNTTMDIEHFAALLQQGAMRFECPNFGLRLGAKQDFRILGPLGLLLKNCITPRQALKAARGFITFHNQSEYWDYTEQGNNLYLKRYDIFHDVSDTRQYRELSISACYQLCKLIMGDHFRGVRIEISHSPLYKSSEYEKYFKMPVLFNCEQDQLVIPSHHLDSPIPDADQTIHALAEHYLAKFNQQNINNTVKQVTALIQQTISDQNQSIDNIANLLGISRRTLQRRLSEQGVIFKHLLQDIRIKTACWYLTSSAIDMTLLSHMLGYSDISGFSRAFKRAMGQSPLKWRKENTALVS